MPIQHPFPFDVNVRLEGTRLYHAFRSLCIATDAFRLALAALLGRYEKLKGEREIMLLGRLGINIVVPSLSVFGASARHEESPEVWIKLTRAGKPQLSPGFEERSSPEFFGMLEDSTTAQFVIYYERYIDWVKSQVSFDIRRLPPAWAFGRVIRNALVHDGIVSIDDKNFAPVQWRGLTYGPVENGRYIMHNDLEVPDVYLLLIDMDAELQGAGFS